MLGSSQGKILHLFGWDKKFVLPFIQFVEQNLDAKKHCFIIYGPIADGEIPVAENITHYRSPLKSMLSLWAQMRVAKQIILHGLFSSHLFYLLALHPWVLRKCYWTIWGGDLYVRNASNKDWRWRKNEIFRSFLIRRIGHFVTHIKGDYELARQWYGAQGQWYECFMYPSNLYHEPPFQPAPHEGINILVGNSADPSNNHKEVLNRLWACAQDVVQIYCPLSYGDQAYAQEISDYGKSIFGNKFVALRDFIPFDEYLKLLGDIDIAIFNHRRQQGMGNLTTLLGMGKRIYLRGEIASYHFLRSIGLAVFDVNDVFWDLTQLPEDMAKNNSNIIKIYFSKDKLVNQHQEIFQ